MCKFLVKSIILAYLTLGCMSGSAQTVRFQTKQLEQLAHRVKFNQTVSTNKHGYYEAGTFNGHALVAASDSTGRIVHLGIKLFNTELNRRELPSIQGIILDFLERYTLDLISQKEMTQQEKLDFDKLYFRQGTVKSLLQLADTIPFTMTVHDNHYEVSWISNDKPIITIAFPIQFELLLGANAVELKQHLKDFIRSAQPRTQNIHPQEQMELLNDSIYMRKTDTYQIETVSDATYYNKVGENYKPVFDDEHAEYAAANLMQGLIADDGYRMYVVQPEYKQEGISYLITLRQWLDYQAEQGLKVYFGLEEQREDGLMALIIAQNKQLGYNHMMSVIIPSGFAKNKNAILKARLTAFIPTHNLQNLYQQEVANKKRIKWQ